MNVLKVKATGRSQNNEGINKKWALFLPVFLSLFTLKNHNKMIASTAPAQPSNPKTGLPEQPTQIRECEPITINPMVEYFVLEALNVGVDNITPMQLQFLKSYVLFN